MFTNPMINVNALCEVIFTPPPGWPLTPTPLTIAA